MHPAGPGALSLYQLGPALSTAGAPGSRVLGPLQPHLRLTRRPRFRYNQGLPAPWRAARGTQPAAGLRAGRLEEDAVLMQRYTPRLLALALGLLLLIAVAACESNATAPTATPIGAAAPAPPTVPPNEALPGSI